MKNVTQALLAFAMFFLWVNTFGQSLGAYPNTVIISGQNTTVIPSAPPTGVDYLFAYTNTNFIGILSVNPTSGVVSVTNALTAGTFLVTVKAFGQNTTTQNFSLTVNNPFCSDAEFIENENLVGFYYSLEDIAIGDFNNDGLQDFFTSDDSEPYHSIGLGNGMGGFSGYVSPQCIYGCQYTFPGRGIALGDFNGDGYHDAILNRSSVFSTYNYTFSWGNYIAGVTKIPQYSAFDLPGDASLMIFYDKGDFNNDGFPDLVAKHTQNGNIYIRFGSVTGNNIPLKIIEPGFPFHLIKIGDFNSDGNQDMAILVSSSIIIKLGDGIGGFNNGATVPVGSSPYDLVIGDFNSDGKQDIATSNGSKTLSIRLGDGLGGFAGNTEIELIESGGDAAIGDFNGDGKQDLAINHSSISKVSIVLGDGLGGFSVDKQVNVGEGSRSLAVGDLNGDGIHDFVTVNNGYSIRSVSIRLGIPNLATRVTLKGNGVNISNEDYSPSITDHTDFGILSIGSSVTRNFTIQNTSGSPINLLSIKSKNPHFVVDGEAAQIGVDSSTQIAITFSPQIESVENDTISLFFGDCIGSFKFAIRGKTAIPILGTYSNTTIMAGENITITPSAAPIRTNSAVAFTNTNFTGVFTVNPTTGNLKITNAKQAGIYTVTVMAIGTDTSTQTFTLTVSNPECSEGLFKAGVNYSAGLKPTSVAVGDFNNDGKQDVSIANFGSKTVSIRLGNGMGEFTGNMDVPVSFYNSIAIGDFNGDGNQDFAAAHYQMDYVSIKLGDGLGGFSGSTKFSVGRGPISLAVGDFNGDGKQDFVTTNILSNNITIRLGDGNGGFGVSKHFAVGKDPRAVVIGDFNGDGKQDIATANQMTYNISILIGDGVGGFDSAKNIYVDVSPSALAIGDFNGDGNQDIVTNEGSKNVGILLGDGMGGFSKSVISIGDYPVFISVGDFNGDGKQDFVTSNNNGTCSLLLGDGSGGFISNSSVLGTAYQARPLAMGDFNGDGIHDFATANNTTNDFSIFMGKYACKNVGTYPNTTIIAGQNITINPLAAPTNNTSAVVLTPTNFTGVITVNPTTGDVRITNAKQAGIYDIIVRAFGIDTSTQYFTLTVTKPECSEGLFNSGVNGAVGMHPSYVAVGDFNNDGKQDLAIANSGENTVSIRLGNGLGGFTGSVVVPVGFNPSSIAIGDFNSDGFQDFAAANFDSDNVSIKLGDGLGGFSGSGLLDVGDGPIFIAIGDFNVDGKQDIVTANSNANNVTVKLGDGTGGFGSSVITEVENIPICLAIGDFNGDGKPDMITANKNSNDLRILIGEGMGFFDNNHFLDIGEINPSFVAIGDFNNDGKQDLVVANEGSNNATILLGDGYGEFPIRTSVEIPSSPIAIAIGDFNGDGHQDFASLQAMMSEYIRIWLGDGLGNFVSHTDIISDGVLPISLAIGDFNNDGIHDIATANRSSQNFSIYKGRSAGDLTNTWLGISEDWQTPENWSTGKVPVNCTKVIINSGVPFSPIVSGIHNSCYSLLLNSGATIHMEIGAKLFIKGK